MYKIRPGKTLSKLFEVVLFLVILLINLVPIYWSFITSIKTKSDIFAFPPKLWNFKPSLEHYQTIISDGYLRSILNSIFYCALVVVIGLFLGYLAAYGLQRYNFKFKKLIFILIVSCVPLSIGSAALIIPNYVFMSQIGLINKWYTLVILFTAYNLPMAIWILKSGVEGVPIEIEEAAKIDGCGKQYIIWRMVFPLMLPSISSASLFLFIGSWNEFILAAIMVDSPGLKPVQLAIYNYLGFFGQEWGPLTASASLAIIPTLIIFTFLGKMLISGLTQGSVKG
jgi:ABC-type glycerol-3-phosphate transport system permease component